MRRDSVRDPATHHCRVCAAALLRCTERAIQAGQPARPCPSPPVGVQMSWRRAHATHLFCVRFCAASFRRTSRRDDETHLFCAAPSRGHRPAPQLLQAPLQRAPLFYVVPSLQQARRGSSPHFTHFFCVRHCAASCRGASSRDDETHLTPITLSACAAAPRRFVAPAGATTQLTYSVQRRRAVPAPQPLQPPLKSAPVHRLVPLRLQM